MNPVPSDLVATLVGAVAVERDVVRVTGDDAEAYLQGQLSQDLATIGARASGWSFVLEPQGHVIALMRVTRDVDGSFLLDVDAGHGEALVTRLRRFLLRVDAVIEPLDWSMVSVRGTRIGQGEVGASDVVVDALWPGIEGIDILGPSPQRPAGVPELTTDALDALRVLAGVPRHGAEIAGKTVPNELPILVAAVSFTKGCYTGQELVARVDSRGGNVPRRLSGVLIDADVAPAAGADVLVGETVVGTLTTVVAVPAGAVALASIKRGTEAGASVTFASDEAHGEIVALPMVGSAP